METFNMPSIILDESKQHSIICDKDDFEHNKTSKTDHAYGALGSSVEVIDEQEILDFIKNEEVKVNTDFITTDVPLLQQQQQQQQHSDAVPSMNLSKDGQVELDHLGSFGGANVGGLSYSLL